MHGNCAGYSKVIRDFIDTIRNIFRVACFTTSPFSQLMWGAAYANNHRGFCIEYTIDPSNLAYRQVYYNLFPVIYCNTRKKVTEELLQFQFKILLQLDIGMFTLMVHYGKVLIGPIKMSGDCCCPGSTDGKYVVNFFKITKVYLGIGCRRSKEEKSLSFVIRAEFLISALFVLETISKCKNVICFVRIVQG